MVKSRSKKSTPKPPRHRRGIVLPAVGHLRSWREFRGIKTQGELAIKCGVTRSVISRLESGVLEYRQKWLRSIARALDCTEADLIGVDPNLRASIFQIYSRIPEADRIKAERLLKTLAGDSV